eukprot:6203321-Pleurochrysis_carterae.AAC.1
MFVGTPCGREARSGDGTGHARRRCGCRSIEVESAACVSLARPPVAALRDGKGWDGSEESRGRKMIQAHSQKHDKSG